ncbi:MAG: cbb3-type cytochrome c oxidase subunit 3 [Sphingomonadales bacterium]|nr:cbb3-type cytochrome c oxidase subunit 3 [Sphingomonadales bacterium]MBD3774075.1 cbb3-type cytochrome c oxidase subunit 3 [Paracoccaceae bacterium]MBD3813757.1 cbb3-type cytochrome c oxidase subunit 3 [Betaproteobacteria bacterium]
MMRHLADSWGLLTMVAVFIGLCLWALRPGAKEHHRDAANAIFKDENDG